MIIYLQPTKTKFEHKVCDFHKKHPLVSYAGCTCTSTYSSQVINDWDSVMDEALEKHIDAWQALANL